LTAEVARRYLDVIRAQAQASLKAEKVAQRIKMAVGDPGPLFEHE